MYLFKNGSKYYLAKNNNKYHGWDGGTYVIKDGRLVWANPNIYLQGDGNSWIDSGIYGDQDTEVISKWLKDANSNLSVYGSYGSNNNHLTMCAAGSVNLRFNGQTYLTGMSNNVIYKTIQNKNGITINNTFHAYNNVSNFITSHTLKIFKIDGFNYNPLIGNFYYFKISKNNNLIQHLVPVPKGLLIGNFVVPSNGMFDIIEQKFYPNQGTGEFTIGGIPEDYIIDNGKLIWCDDNIYLQSSGTQYINTNFNANQDTRVKMRASTSTIGSNQSFFVGRNAAKVNTFAAWVLKNGSITIFRNDYNTTQTNTTLNITVNTIYNIDFNKNKFYVDDVLYSTSTYSQFQSTYPIILGASTRYTTSDTNYQNFFKGNNYNCEIYDNDTLVRYFVPVPKDIVIGSFTVPSNGMFDIVNQQFYPNQGTGSFTYGKDN